MKIPGSLQSRPEAVRAMAIVEGLEKPSADADVFAAFEELDALPPDVVRAVLTAWTGPAPDPERLDAATRRAHGFPPPLLALQTVKRVKLGRIEDLGRVGQEQLRKAGATWDGLDLPASARLADDDSESSFGGTIELRTLADAQSSPMFDVVLYRGDSGAIFTAGSTDLVGAVAYGVVEMKDRRARLAVQGALSVSMPHDLDLTSTEGPVAERRGAEPLPEPQDHAAAAEPAPAKKKAAAAKAAPEKKAAVSKAAPAKKKAAVSEAAPAKKKAAAKAAPKKKAAASEAAPKKKAATAPKKTAATKTTAKKSTAATKTTAKKSTAVKKTTAKKSTAAKKTTAVKKSTAAKKSTAVKKTAATKSTAKKSTAKKTTAKKTTAKKR